MKYKFIGVIPLLLLSYFVAGCTTNSGEAELQNQISKTESPSNMEVADANVLYVKIVQQQDDKWTFYVTVEHPDTGWDDYVNGWAVTLADGTTLTTNSSSEFTRSLLHPHVDEQPFTRNQSGIEIPAGVESVTVKAHDLLDGFGGNEIVIDLTQKSGEKYEIIKK